MPTLSPAEWENLQADLSGLKTLIFVGVLVGAGSMILHFSDGSSLLVQCPFEVYDDGTSNKGHGQSPGTAVILFGLLNEHIFDVSVGVDGQITLAFGAARGIRIIPDSSGFESYVLRTAKGVTPIL
jgi:hypothetical protein